MEQLIRDIDPDVGNTLRQREQCLERGKRDQVIALGRLGWSLRRIEKAVHIRRETVGGYLRAAGIQVRPPGAWGSARSGKTGQRGDHRLRRGVYRRKLCCSRSGPGRSQSASACEPWREVIELGLSRGRNAKAIWQDLVDDHGFTAGYQSVRRFVGKLRESSSPEARVVITTPPGKEAQVDHGSRPMVRDRQTGKYRRTRSSF